MPAQLIHLISIDVLDILYVGLLLLVVKLFEDGFEKIRLPAIVGAVIGGIVLGKSVLNVVQPTVTINFMVELGIIMILFLAGANEFDLGSSSQNLNRRKYFLGAMLGWAGPTAIMATAMYFFYGLKGGELFFLSAVLGMSSVAPLAKVLRELNISKTVTAINSFTFSLYVEVIGLLGATIALEAASSAGVSQLTLLTTLFSVSSLILLLYTLRAKVPLLIKTVEQRIHSREASFAVMISLVLIVGYVGEAIHFNAAITALILGVMFSKYVDERPNLLERLQGFTYGFFEPMFFGGLGLLVNIRLLPSIPLLMVGMLALMLGTKVVFGFFGGVIRGARHPWINGVGSSLKGGVDGALLLTGLAAGVISDRIYSAALIAILLELIVGSSLMAALKSRISDQIKPDTEVSLTNSWVKFFVQDVPAIRIAQMLPDVIANQDDTVDSVIKEMVRLNIPAAAVVDSHRFPVGVVLLADIIHMSEKEYRNKKIKDVMRVHVVRVYEGTPAWDLLDIFRTTKLPLVAVVDQEGKITGTASEREFLLYLTSTTN